jgi:hypothetical protein
MDPNTLTRQQLDDEAKILWDLQQPKNGGIGVSVVQTICFYLMKGKFETALLVRQIDGDKTRQYEDIETELRRFFGCRIHAKHNCDNWLCSTKTSYPKRKEGAY